LGDVNRCSERDKAFAVVTRSVSPIMFHLIQAEWKLREVEQNPKTLYELIVQGMQAFKVQKICPEVEQIDQVPPSDPRKEGYYTTISKTLLRVILVRARSWFLTSWR
jgi:hypothetical protein